MAANPDFKKIVLKDVELLWPRLDQPYRYDPHNERTEACPANAQGARYSVAFKVPMARGKELFEELKAHYADCQSRSSKLPKFSSVFSMKKDTEEGAVTFTARKRAMSNDGKENKPPRVVGPDLQDLEDKAIWTGSTGNLRLLAFPATNPQDKSGGISLLLDAVQVTEAVYGGDNLEDDFGPAQEARKDFSDWTDDEKQTAKQAEPADAEF